MTLLWKSKTDGTKACKIMDNKRDNLTLPKRPQNITSNISRSQPTPSEDEQKTSQLLTRAKGKGLVTILVSLAVNMTRISREHGLSLNGRTSRWPFPTLLSLQVSRAQGGVPAYVAKSRTSRIPSLPSSLHLSHAVTQGAFLHCSTENYLCLEVGVNGPFPL